jgi:asparagine synthase (glutamine-hydrolysing)
MEWNNKIGAMHGLEMAYPFLDRDLIAFLMAIPGEVQCRNGIHKGLLRDALKNVLPEAIASRVSKADFTDVVNQGMAQDYERLGQCLHPRALVAARGYVRPRHLTEMRAHEFDATSSTSETAWALEDLLSLELWLQQFFGPAETHLGMEVC